MSYYGNDTTAPAGLFDACQQGAEAVRTWARSKPDSVLTSALDSIYMHHMQWREVIQTEVNDRREQRNFRYVVLAIVVSVLSLIVSLVALIR